MNELDVTEKSIPIFCNLKKKFWSYFFWIPLLISLTSLEEKLERKVELIWEIQREVGRNSSLGGWWGQPWGQWAHWGPFRGWVKCAKETSGMELGPICSFNRLLSGGQGEKVAYSCLPLVLCPVPGIPGFSSLSYPSAWKLFLRTFSLAWENPSCVISASPFCSPLWAFAPSLSTVIPPRDWKWKDMEALLRDAGICVGWQVQKTLFCSPPSLSSFISYVAHGV